MHPIVGPVVPGPVESGSPVVGSPVVLDVATVAPEEVLEVSAPVEVVASGEVDASAEELASPDASSPGQPQRVAARQSNKGPRRARSSDATRMLIGVPV